MCYDTSGAHICVSILPRMAMLRGKSLALLAYVDTHQCLRRPGTGRVWDIKVMNATCRVRAEHGLLYERC